MSFTVQPDPRVRLAVSRLTRPQRAFFEQVLAILKENPYRFRDLVQRCVWADGRVFYQYYDGVIPLVFLYRVFPPEESDWEPGEPGFVYIFDSERPWW